MKYRTIENASQVRLRNERRTLVQHNKFPLEDLMGKIVTKDRRANPDRRIEGLDVTETTIYQIEFQEYFDKSQKGE